MQPILKRVTVANEAPGRSMETPPRRGYVDGPLKAPLRPKTNSGGEVTFHHPPTMRNPGRDVPTIPDPSPNSPKVTQEGTVADGRTRGCSGEENAPRHAIDDVAPANLPRTREDNDCKRLTSVTGMVSAAVQADAAETTATGQPGRETDLHDCAMPPRLAVEDLRDTQRNGLEDMYVNFFHPVNITAPSEKNAQPRLYELMTSVSAEEEDALLTGTGDTYRPRIPPTHDHLWISD